MSYNADFGPLVIADDICQSVVNALRAWIPTQLHQIELERGLPVGTIARPKPGSFATVRREQDWEDYQLPVVLVEEAGTSMVSKASANGAYQADWNIVITCVLRGLNFPDTQKWTSHFEGAVRRAMLNQPQELAGRVWWMGTDPIRPVVDQTDSGRYMCAAISRFKMAVDDVAQDGAGPTFPSDPYPTPPADDPDQDYSPLVEVDGVILDLDGLSPSQQIGG